MAYGSRMGIESLVCHPFFARPRQERCPPVSWRGWSGGDVEAGLDSHRSWGCLRHELDKTVELIGGLFFLDL